MADNSFLKDNRLIVYLCLAVAPVATFLEYKLSALWFAVPAVIAIVVCENNLIDKKNIKGVRPADIGNIVPFAPPESETYATVRDPITGEMKIDKVFQPPRQYSEFDRR